MRGQGDCVRVCPGTVFQLRRIDAADYTRLPLLNKIKLRLQHAGRLHTDLRRLSQLRSVHQRLSRAGHHATEKSQPTVAGPVAVATAPSPAPRAAPWRSSQLHIDGGAYVEALAYLGQIADDHGIETGIAHRASRPPCSAAESSPARVWQPGLRRVGLAEEVSGDDGIEGCARLAAPPVGIPGQRRPRALGACHASAIGPSRSG